MPADDALTYALTIWLERPLRLNVGALGCHDFPGGAYRYVGSAKRNTAARLWRHLGHRERRLRWHIDYLLVQPGVEIIDVNLHHIAECTLNQSLSGAVLVQGFGASDCRNGCRSHLRYLGPMIPPLEAQ